MPGEDGPRPTQPFAYLPLDNASKAWMKRYRTEIAASSASLLSTLTAVWLDSFGIVDWAWS